MNNNENRSIEMGQRQRNREREEREKELNEKQFMWITASLRKMQYAQMFNVYHRHYHSLRIKTFEQKKKRKEETKKKI